MLAPTREQVADLNHRARAHRLHDTNPGREVELADGNRAGVGDTVITRANARRLLTTGGGNWVKNGDRWTIQNVIGAGDLQVKHVRTGRTATPPTGYVRDAVELGYATTIHAAQGVTADTMHGLATGDASRQQLYTMLTRGRTANHLYLPVVGDGDPHTLIHPDTISPTTATELLEQILARDDTPTSATTLRRAQQDPTIRLGTAVDRYLDALHLAAELTAGPDGIAALDHAGEQVLPGLTHEPAWPTLRAHLLLNASEGIDPEAALQSAATSRELVTASDRAAVLNSRLEGGPLASGGPLPWLPALPTRLSDDPEWGPYLKARSQLVTDLADRVSADATPRRPTWAADHPILTAHSLVADVEVWRAANRVNGSDGSATGALVPNGPSRAWQAQLDRRLAAGTTEGRAALLELITELAPGAAHDHQAPRVADRLAGLVAGGFDGRKLLQQAAAAGPLPDDHPASTLWWRVVDQLPGAGQRQQQPSPPRTPRPPATSRRARARSPQRPPTVSPPPCSPGR